jgi:hypothetical protein
MLQIEHDRTSPTAQRVRRAIGFMISPVNPDDLGAHAAQHHPCD